MRRQSGKLFSGGVSSLDAFSSYPQVRSCPAVPYRTTGRPEAPTLRSSRTERLLPSAFQHVQKRDPSFGEVFSPENYRRKIP